MVYVQLEALINASVWQDGPEEKYETPPPPIGAACQLSTAASGPTAGPNIDFLEPQKTVRQFRPALATVSPGLPERLWTPALGDLHQSC